METRKGRQDCLELMPRHTRSKRPNLPKKDLLRNRREIVRRGITRTGATSFTDALQKLRDQPTDVYGPDDDQCIRVKSEEFKMVRVEFPNAQAKHYRPYKIAWLVKHKRWPRRGRECSHLCGSKECFNVNHLTEETNAQNNRRRRCHHKLTKWAEQQQPDDLKITFDTFDKGNCGCRKECFIML